MPDYKAMYYSLAAQVANAIELLISAQQNGEESILEETSPVLMLYQTKIPKIPIKKERPSMKTRSFPFNESGTFMLGKNYAFARALPRFLQFSAASSSGASFVITVPTTGTPSPCRSLSQVLIHSPSPQP